MASGRQGFENPGLELGTVEIVHIANLGIRAGAEQKGRGSRGLAANWLSLSSSLATFGWHNYYCEKKLKLIKAICVSVPSHGDQLPCTRGGHVVAKWVF